MYKNLIDLIKQSLLTYANYYNNDRKGTNFNDKNIIENFTEKTLENLEKVIDKYNKR